MVLDQDSSGSSSSDSSDSETSEKDIEETEEVDPLRLKVPSFSVPDHDDFELWTIRIPGDVDPSTLDGIELTMGTKDIGKIRAGELMYGFSIGDAAENESFRVLIDNKKKGTMVPSEKSFLKHINIIQESSLKETVDTELAPGLDRAPKPVDYVRHAYSSIPQRAGLKRRWMPMGVPYKAPKTPVSLKRNADEVNHSDSINNGDDAGNKTAIKIESSSAKKKSKKEKKKSKKIKKKTTS